jgi:rod shape-determining protein MreD
MPRNIKPDLLLILVVNVGLYDDKERAVVLGFAVGLLQDAFTSVPMGAFSLAKSVAGLVACGISSPLIPENRFVQALCLGAGLAVQNAIVFMIMATLRQHEFTFSEIGTTLGLEAAYTFLFAPPAFYIMKLLRSLRRTRYARSDW